MKKILITIVLSGVTSMIYAQKKGVHFEQDLGWQQVLEKAHREKKFIFVDCYATWCGPCKQMDSEVYPNDSVAVVMNSAFICYKVQCDSTKKDPEAVKARYTDVRLITATYGVNAYPTLLFFSPAGNLVHKAIGGQMPSDFLKIAGDAQNPSRQFYTLLNRFKTGAMRFEEMPGFVEEANNLEDNQTAEQVENTYVKDCIDHLPDTVFFTRQNLGRLAVYQQQLSSSNRSFNKLLQNATWVDSVMQRKGFSAGIIGSVIYKEEVAPELAKSERSNIEPGWDVITAAITSKYGKRYIGKNLIIGKFRWYRYKKDWERYCRQIIAVIEFDPAYAWGLSDVNFNKVTTLNQAAWEIFQKGHDKETLERALYWMTAVVDSTTVKFAYAATVRDTKANVLYKLGRKKDAVALEEEAVKIKPDDKDIQANLEKMKAGKPTW